ncbi:hypothetical protein [Chitinophaga pinensis]|uniref:Uncharacterized protein n=1 Tax=Chitinophaga pinensis TaxID=79329 RepID=A0A5C6LVX5_9BACT|nr:hypothetical protein [Chitinophaga pinensis]TWW00738.1 hypothetical protein FEF09_09560 [Chitinophaga pinensis]
MNTYTFSRKNIIIAICVVCITPLMVLTAIKISSFLEKAREAEIMQQIRNSNTRTKCRALYQSADPGERRAGVEYFVGGRQYNKEQIISPDFSIDRDAFIYEVLYDSKKPQNSWVNFDKPLMTNRDSIRTGATIETVTDSTITFSYEFLSDTLYCTKALPKGKTVKKGDIYAIEYEFNHPKQVNLELE